MKIQEQLMYLLKAAKDTCILFVAILLGLVMFAGVVSVGIAFTPVVIFILVTLFVIGCVAK